MIDIEQRLRDAYGAKAATVTEAGLRDEPFQPAFAPVVPLRRRRAPFLGAAAVVAIGAGIVAAIVLAGGSPTPPAQPRPTTTSQPAPKPDVLPRGAVPWNAVGDGWTIVQRSRTARTTVELVAPTGTAYRIATLPGGVSATLWSPDHARVLVSDGGRVEELTLRTGALRTVPLPAGAQPVSYARPTGTAVLAVGKDGVLRRYDVRTGALQQAYPTATSGGGGLNLQYVLYDADGGLLAVGAQRGLVVLGNNGAAYQAYPAPAGTASCVPVRWNGTSSVDAACSGTATTNVWRFPLEGAAAVQLTRGPHGQNLFGYTDIWSYDGGRLGLAPNGCGPASLVRFDTDGVGTDVNFPIPRGVAGPFEYQGHSGALVRLLGHSQGQCSPTGFVLLSYDAAANTARVLAPAANSDGVLRPEVIVPPQDR
jgi:hypothetical protein